MLLLEGHHQRASSAVVSACAVPRTMEAEFGYARSFPRNKVRQTNRNYLKKPMPNTLASIPSCSPEKLRREALQAKKHLSRCMDVQSHEVPVSNGPFSWR
ncbi:hypothetical protein Y1Q_0005757 [Alligator mississippiensis]|uniref:Uncharacterized protein n=1 Tax=Alligator mississippiensis TaxID=8496 RepID=A0A151MFU7_ALLMI|nr:hypothetical protein Y1Q_0005757 [Alligator mississippiensis]